MSVITENKKEAKEKVYPPPGEVEQKGSKDDVSSAAKITNNVTKDVAPKMAIPKTGTKRPSPGTSFSFGNKKKQSGITIQLQPQVCMS